MAETQTIIKITPSSDNYDRIRFVLKAVAKQESRDWMNYLHVSKEVGAWATDGHRLHRDMTGADLDHGTYAVESNAKKGITLRKTEDARLPDITKLMKEQRPEKDDDWITVGAGYPDGALYEFHIRYQCPLNADYWRDALSYCDGRAKVGQRDGEKQAPVFVEYESAKIMAAVMPMRADGYVLEAREDQDE